MEMFGLNGHGIYTSVQILDNSPLNFEDLTPSLALFCLSLALFDCYMDHRAKT